ncbi:MAG: hypothetical protein D3924_20465 [Candidatus Electrothrix sp. AR4]|nr:hypothetical protein [Candidatus Electrothrix sp. AR4]
MIGASSEESRFPRKNMGKKTLDKMKKKCCRKYRKKSKHCKRCPEMIREQCQLEGRYSAMSKKKDDKKKDKKKAAKKAAKKLEKKSCKKSCEKKSAKKKDKKKDKKKGKKK